MLDRVFLSGGAGGGGWIAHVGSAQENYPQGIALDSDKNIYLNSYTTNPSSPYGYGVIKLSNLGVIQWQRKLSKGSNNALGTDITVDSSNNVYAVGYFPFNGYYQSGILAKYNSSGTLQWQRSLNPRDGNIYPSKVTTDSGGNVYFCGSGAWTGNPAWTCGFYAKYNSSGTFQDTKAVKVYSAYTTRSDNSASVKIDTSGNIYVCGYTSDYSNSRYPSTAYNISIAKFDSANNFLWVKKLIGNNNDYGSDLVFDSSGNVYIAAQTKYVNDHGLLLKYNASGVLQWQRQLGDTSAFYAGWTKIAIDGSGNIYCAGYSNVAGSADAIFAKYNSSGTLQWQRRLGINGGTYVSEYAQGLTIDSDGNLYTCVSFYTSTYQMLVAKLPSDGSGIGTYSVNGLSFTYAAISLTDSTPSYTHDTDYGLAGGGVSNNGSVTADLNDSSLTLTSVVTQI